MAGKLPFAVLGYARDIHDVQALCDAAAWLGQWQLRRGYAPLIFDSPAVYRREEQRTLPGVERVQLPEETHAMGGGDCDDLAPWACASFRELGIESRPLVVESPGIGYHVLTVFRDPRSDRWRYYDPSAERGMYSISGRSERRRNRRRRIAAAKRRAESLIGQIERMNPASSAARALGAEALRLLDMVDRESSAERSADSEGDV